ncbi:MAG: UDP-N-acetylmuramate dehydrogenase [Sterolibacterium sp.]|nr:UDP-N-acetylmuramate dehydrogenase [Sterolibacterium sp.]
MSAQADPQVTDPQDAAPPVLRGVLRLDEPMARHVSWRAGGPAARAYFPADLADLCAFLATLQAGEPVLFVGLGSNLLVRDGGFNGTVIFTHGSLNRLCMQEDGLVYAEAGVASPKLARFVANQGCAAGEFLAGIPGSLGGALAMNAGCHGGETWQHVVRVLMVDRQGRCHERGPDEFAVAYRHVALRAASDEWFAAAWLRFPAGDSATARARIKQLLERRIATQPLSQPNAGSVFRNPPGDHAARLIEAAGLKGHAIGGARVSEMHANFVVNPENRASATEIEMLVGQIQATVREKFDIELVPEVRIVGEKLETAG